MYRQYLKVICVSEEVEKSLEPFVSKDRCCVIQNGIDLKQFKSKKKKNDVPVILSVGSLCARKNQAVLIRAMQTVDNAKLLLVGDGEDKAQLNQLIQNLKLDDKVILLGLREDVLALMQSATVYVQPSLHEGLSIAILEAMGSGLPVIGSDVSGIKTLVKNVGLLVTPGAEQAWAKQINRVLEDPKLAKQMGQQSKKQAANYSLEKTAEALMGVYHDIIRRKTVK